MRSRRVRVASSSAGLFPARFRLLSPDSNRFDSKLGLALPLNGCLSVQPSAHFDRHGERFNVFAGGVYGEACAPSSHHARRGGKWHGAMPARSYGDAHHAAGAADLRRRGVRKRERHEPARAVRLRVIAPDSEPFHSMERVDGELRHGLGVFENLVHPQGFHVLDGARPADCLCDRRRSHLVLDGPWRR